MNKKFQRQINISAIVSKIKLNPYFITGFVDAEASFIISIRKNSNYKTGWKIEARFQIGLHQKDRAILELIQSYFGLGMISKLDETSVEYRVTRLQDLIKIIDHFNKYSLITQKRADFILWKEVVELISRKEHLTTEGLQQIVNIRATVNWGLTDKLKRLSLILSLYRDL